MDLNVDGYLALKEWLEYQRTYEISQPLGYSHLTFTDQYDIFTQVFLGDANLVGDLRVLTKDESI
jgi:hypothetical protein